MNLVFRVVDLGNQNWSPWKIENIMSYCWTFLPKSLLNSELYEILVFCCDNGKRQKMQDA